MELSKLIEGVKIQRIRGDLRREIGGIAYHSQQVRKGFLFAAVRGLKMDGHRFIEDALARGAEAILLEEDRKISQGTLLFVGNSRRALAEISANLYGNPSSKLSLIGVTGTNGKTTITYLLESILRRAGYRPGVIGTINYRYGESITPAPNTTPESLDLQRILAEMVANRVSHVLMEVSSHGLDLDRVYGCQFDGAIYTNLTQDHLDYHPTLDDYFECKRKLFSDYLVKSPKPRRFAVTNEDDPRGEEIVRGLDLPIFRYGLKGSSEISAERFASTMDGLSCRMKTPEGPLEIRSQLIGEFNLYNILAAVGAGIALGLPISVLKAGIESLRGVPGRLEKVENARGIYVLVDYAHTPDALERSLSGITSILQKSRAPHREQKILTVFGCGGDRDRTKRPLMGEVAAKWSDLAILTSDNPRTENPSAILDEIEKGVQKAGLKICGVGEAGRWTNGRSYLKFVDRREALRAALRLARPSDIVLIAGKGHEDYQVVGTRKFPFDDRVEAKRILEEM